MVKSTLQTEAKVLSYFILRMAETLFNILCNIVIFLVCESVIGYCLSIVGNINFLWILCQFQIEFLKNNDDGVIIRLIIKRTKKKQCYLHIDQIKITQYTVQMKHSHFESFSNKTTPKACLIQG